MSKMDTAAKTCSGNVKCSEKNVKEGNGVPINLGDTYDMRGVWPTVR